MSYDIAATYRTSSALAPQRRHEHKAFDALKDGLLMTQQLLMIEPPAWPPWWASILSLATASRTTDGASGLAALKPARQTW
jgi:hypothetical protein